jgi:hypothetical protein
LKLSCSLWPLPAQTDQNSHSTHLCISFVSQTAIEASFGTQSERAATAAACARHSAELAALRKRNSYVEQQIQTELADKMELIAQVCGRFFLMD